MGDNDLAVQDLQRRMAAGEAAQAADARATGVLQANFEGVVMPGLEQLEALQARFAASELSKAKFEAEVRGFLRALRWLGPLAVGAGAAAPKLGALIAAWLGGH